MMFEQELTCAIPSVRNFALKLTKHDADAQDLVQDTCLKAWRSRDTFMPGTNFQAWIFQVCFTCFLERDRKRRRIGLHEVPQLDYLDELEPDPTPLPDSGHGEFSESVQYALTELNQDQFATCMLMYVYDFRMQEIADLHGVAIGTIMSRAHRGRRKMAAALTGG